MSRVEFNPLTGRFDLVGGSSGATEDGTQAKPFTFCNVKKVPDAVYHLIKTNAENVVTRMQKVDGILIIDGVNTILGDEVSSAPPSVDCGDCYLDALIFG